MNLKNSYDFLDKFEVLNPRGIFLLGHGLNLKIDSMNDFILDFNRKGFSVYRVCLDGHRKNQNFKNTSDNKWKKEMSLSLKVLKDKADNIPMYFFGYSLSCLVLLNNLKKDSKLQAAIFLAPPLRIKPIVNALTFLSNYLPALSFKSLGPLDDAAQLKTHTNLYKSFRKNYNDLNKITDPLTINIPTLILVNKKDEVVSTKGIKSFIERKKLSNWTIEALPGNAPYKAPYHFIFSKKYLDDLSWNALSKRIENFINSI